MMDDEPPAAVPAAEKKNGPGARVLAAVKWLVMAAAVYCLWREGVLSFARVRLSERAVWALPAAFVCIAASTLCMAVRFHGLFRRLDCPGSLRRHIRLNFSALLAQQAGSEAGFDVFRLVGVRAMGIKSADILAVLIVDRLIGIVALVAVTLAALAVYWTGPRLALYLAGAGVLLAVPVMYGVFRRLRGIGPESRLWKIPGSRFVQSVAVSALRFQGHGVLLATLLLLSVVSNLCLFAGLFLCGTALPDVSLAMSEALLGGALTSFTGVLPLPLAGLGVGEVAFASVVSAMRGGGDMAEFAAVFLVNRLVVLTLAVVSWAWVTLVSMKSAEKD